MTTEFRSERATPLAQVPMCEARAGVIARPWGFSPAYCRGKRGLRTVVVHGITHYYCSAKGHQANVLRYYGLHREEDFK